MKFQIMKLNICFNVTCNDVVWVQHQYLFYVHVLWIISLICISDSSLGLHNSTICLVCDDSKKYFFFQDNFMLDAVLNDLISLQKLNVKLKLLHKLPMSSKSSFFFLSFLDVVKIFLETLIS